ncbi:MAG: hypothetical protein OQL19_21520 [Gammaproteobacteria bacterium]|nr:hypothetical protein [Gammaproteobacteria bacterium]
MTPLRMLLIPTLCTMCFTSQTILAADQVTFVPRTWVGVSDYTFKQGARGNSFPEVEFNVTFKMVGVVLPLLMTVFILIYLIKTPLMKVIRLVLKN